ncbi:MAG TPA: M1 family metallopeptidase [Anaerolineaceae bacterium]
MCRDPHPHRRASRLGCVVSACLVLAACARAGISPTSAPATATSLPPAAPSQPAGVPAPQVLPYAWDDRSPFKSDLVPSAQGILSGLPGASVYHIDLVIHPDLASLTGTEEVLYTNRERVPLEAVHFRLFPNLLGGKMSVSNITLDGLPAVAKLAQQDSDLAVQLPEPLPPGARAVLRMDFSAQAPMGAGPGYATFVSQQGILSLAQFYPLIPAYDAAGWHTEIPPVYGDVTYTDTSFYLVRVTAPENLVLAATGTALQQARTGGQLVLLFAAGPVRDFYLQASAGYTTASEKIGETTVNTYVLAQDQDAEAETLSFARSAFASYTRRFGDYPYTSFNISASPTQALGVEYPQEVALALLLYGPSQGTPSLPRRVLEATEAHEIAHQWWYGVVGDDQVNQPWLDEAMAQYSTYLYFLDTYGETAAQSYRQDWVGRWARVNSADIVVGLPVSGYTAQNYGAIVYGRGPLFIEALAKQMGQSRFDAFLKEYYRQFQYGSATTAGYEQLAEKVCGCSLSGLFQEWVGG